MRLIYTPLDFSIMVETEQINVISIEKPSAFTEFSEGLWNQTNGNDGPFILSEADKEFPVSKVISYVVNPFEVDCNNKKILNNLFQESSEILKEEYPEEIIGINQQIINVLDEISIKLPYNIAYNLDVKIEDLFKIYDYKIDSDNTDLLNRLVDYMKVSHQILRVSYFVFLNLKSYLEPDELEKLYEFVRLEHISIILLESIYKSQLLYEIE